MNFGSQNSGSQQQSQATSGFQALSPEIQQAFNTLATNAQGYLNNPSQLTSMYTPTPLTSGEQAGVDTLSSGTAPTAESIKSNIAMQMNPYNQNVIDLINRNAQGQNSALQQQLASAGQFGSNRAYLGANDIDQTTANNIASLLGGEYNTALNNALTTIPNQTAQSANNQIAAGQFVQQQDAQQRQAPITGLGSIAQILGILPTNSGQSTSTGSSSSSGWNFGVG